MQPLHAAAAGIAAGELGRKPDQLSAEQITGLERPGFTVTIEPAAQA